MVSVTAIAAMLLTACSSGAAVADTPAPESPAITTMTTAPASASPATAAEDDDADSNEDIDDLLGDLFDMLEEYDVPTVPQDGTSTDCNPLSPTCLYDPFYGSCEWDSWRGVYTCDSYHYRPGYDCAYDWWWGEYTCREGNDGYGGWGSSWGW